MLNLRTLLRILLPVAKCLHSQFIFILQLDGPKAGHAMVEDDEQDFYNQAYGA